MLGVLCARPKPWIVAALSFLHGGAAHRRLAAGQIRLLGSAEDRWCSRRHYSADSSDAAVGGGGAASIWHAILPSEGLRRSYLKPASRHEQKGEGSWNVAWDARPARWLHRSDSAWLLFGMGSAAACFPDFAGADVNRGATAAPKETACDVSELGNKGSGDYKVTGVLADGRCLFRAIMHGECLRRGEGAPNVDHQRELADELRAKVVDELLKRRKETEWFIEGDFDTYVERIQQPYVWGGEPELLMASHVLKVPISVSMIDRNSNNLIKIADYGEEYHNNGDDPIKVLFHGYGHYDLLETSKQDCHKESP